MKKYAALVVTLLLVAAHVRAQVSGIASYLLVGRSTVAAMPAAASVVRGLWIVTDDADCDASTADDGVTVCVDEGATWAALTAGEGGGGAPDAHASTHEDGGSDEIDVTGLLGLLATAQTPAAHTQAASTISDSTAAGRTLLTAADATAQRTALALGTSAVLNVPAAGNAAVGEVVKGDDTRLTDARTPTSHASTHENGGVDELSVAGLSGVLADAQTPTVHSHTAAGDVDGDLAALDLDESAVESELESVLDLPDLQGAVTDSQVPDTITASNYAPLAGATFTGPVAIDNAQTFKLFEADANGSNFFALVAPSSLTGDTTCTIAADGKIPDSCVGDGTDASGGTSSGTGLQKGDGGGGFTDTGIASANGGVAIVNTSASAVPLSVTGAASQSGNLFNATASGGSAGALFNIDSAGRLHTADGVAGIPTIGNKYASNHASRAGWYWDNGNAAWIYTQGGTDYQFLATNFVRLGSAGIFQWTGGVAVAAADHGVSRCSGGGGVCIGTGGPGTFDQAIKSNGQITGATNAGLKTCAYSTELLTLSTAGATTDTSASLAPATSRVESITYRITTTITTATAFTIKVKAGNSFCSVGTATTSQTTLTSGTTGVLVPCAFADQYNTAAAKLTVDTTGTPGAGAIRLQLHSCAFTAPTS